jgi:hypothetical protein
VIVVVKVVAAVVVVLTEVAVIIITVVVVVVVVVAAAAAAAAVLVVLSYSHGSPSCNFPNRCKLTIVLCSTNEQCTSILSAGQLSWYRTDE